jgi:hypothetical protein
LTGALLPFVALFASDGSGFGFAGLQAGDGGWEGSFFRLGRIGCEQRSGGDRDATNATEFEEPTTREHLLLRS